LWNRFEECPQECIVVVKMLLNKLLDCANCGAIGSIGSIAHISKTISAHLERGGILCGSDVYNISVI
jgi:hypothetical protein